MARWSQIGLYVKLSKVYLISDIAISNGIVLYRPLIKENLGAK